MATVIGLPFRQLLFAYSPSQAEQDIFFRTLEEELRRSATEFKRSQVELIALIKEFVEARQGLFADEEKASRKYIRSLEKAIGLFDESAANYPATISSALASCTQSLTLLQEKSLDLSRAAQTLTPDHITGIVAQFKAVRDQSGDLTEGLGLLRTAVLELERSTAALPDRVSEHLSGVQLDFDKVRMHLRQRVEAIESDVTAIDKVLTDFTILMQERVDAAR